jgi:hypothetical protein
MADLGAAKVAVAPLRVVAAIAGDPEIDAGSTGTAGDAKFAAAKQAARAGNDRVSAAKLGAGIEGNAITAGRG